MRILELGDGVGGRRPSARGRSSSAAASASRGGSAPSPRRRPAARPPSRSSSSSLRKRRSVCERREVEPVEERPVAFWRRAGARQVDRVAGLEDRALAGTEERRSRIRVRVLLLADPTACAARPSWRRAPRSASCASSRSASVSRIVPLSVQLARRSGTRSWRLPSAAPVNGALSVMMRSRCGTSFLRSPLSSASTQTSVAGSSGCQR